MKILCLFGLFPKEYQKEIDRDTIDAKQNAANNLQWAIVDGLDAHKDVELTIYNSMYIGLYPMLYRKAIIPTFEFSHNGMECTDINVGFLNLKFLALASKYFRLIKYVKEWIYANKGEDLAIIGYAMTSPFVDILHYVKKHCSGVKCYLVVPDLPEYMNTGMKGKKLLRAIYRKLKYNHFQKKTLLYDGFVLLTEPMKHWFPKEINYTVVEGMATSRSLSRMPCKKNDKKKQILYSGMVEERYGVIDLVRDFVNANIVDWTLELYGSGSGIERVNELATGCENIHIYGNVSNDVVLRAQSEASLLVNPRNNEGEFTKYSFPSKIIEYMSSGTPMLAYMLQGIPKEYEKHFFHIDDFGSIQEALERITAMPTEKLESMGKSAFDFIKRHKNPKEQCTKIIDMIKGS